MSYTFDFKSFDHGFESESDEDWVTVCRDGTFVSGVESSCGYQKEDHERSHEPKTVKHHRKHLAKGKSKNQRDVWSGGHEQRDRRTAALLARERRDNALALVSRKEATKKMNALAHLDEKTGLREALRQFLGRGTPVPSSYTIPVHLPGFTGDELAMARSCQPCKSQFEVEVKHLLLDWRYGHLDMTSWQLMFDVGVTFEQIFEVNRSWKILGSRAVQDLRLQLLKDGVESNPGPPKKGAHGRKNFPRSEKPTHPKRPRCPLTKMPVSNVVRPTTPAVVDLPQMRKEISAGAETMLHAQMKGKEKESETIVPTEADLEYAENAAFNGDDMTAFALPPTKPEPEEVVNFDLPPLVDVPPRSAQCPLHKAKDEYCHFCVSSCMWPEDHVCAWWTPGEIGSTATYVFYYGSSVFKHLESLNSIAVPQFKNLLNGWCESTSLTSIEATTNFILQRDLSPVPRGRLPRGWNYHRCPPKQEYVEKVATEKGGYPIACYHDVKPTFLVPEEVKSEPAPKDVKVGEFYTTHDCPLDGWSPDDKLLRAALQASGMEVLGCAVDYRTMAKPDSAHDDRLVSDRAIPVVQEPIVFGYVSIVVPKPIPSWRESLTGCLTGYYKHLCSKVGIEKRETMPINFVFCPHQVSATLITYPANVSQETVENSSRQKILRLPSLPIPQQMAAQVASGSEFVTNKIAVRQLNVMGACFPPSRPLTRSTDRPHEPQSGLLIEDLDRLLKATDLEKPGYHDQLQQLRSQNPKPTQGWLSFMDSCATVGLSISVACLTTLCLDILPSVWIGTIQILSCAVCVSAFVATSLLSPRRGWSNSRSSF